MRILAIVLVVFAAFCCSAQAAPDFRNVDAAIEHTIEAGQLPGAVLVVGHDGQIVLRKAYGHRALVPHREAMTADTIFDIASLTKCVVTATAIAQLVERGELRLNDPVSRYLPDFGRDGPKHEITVRQLVTHFSGLREDFRGSPSGKLSAYRMANEEEPITPPGSEFRYSDINFIVLGEIVEKVSGLALNEYAQKNIFTPLGMTHTRYLPPAAWVADIAPTEIDRGNKPLRGVVHDSTAQSMGGVAGHAGVFASADDLAKFAQAILDGKFVVSPAMMQKMIEPQQSPSSTILRGIGWDLDSPFSSNRGALLPVGSFGHTGFTGTSLWIDPSTKTYIVLLTNVVHPKERHPSPAVALREKVANAVAAALQLSPDESETRRWLSLTGYNEAAAGSRHLSSRNGEVRNGIDVLEAEKFARLRKLKPGSELHIGLVTNQTGLDLQGRRTIDVLAKAEGIKLAVLFSPEHGAVGALDTTAIGDSADPATGVKIVSVYGATDAQRRPKLESLRGLDAVVFDIQDAGVRWYTFETTLGYFLEACAKAGVPLIVLDRPNPITGGFVQGPVSDAGKQSFVNYMSEPVRHGMTMGELARMFNGERGLGAKLTVIKMEGWQRGDWFDSTGLVWTAPSPNLRTPVQAILYPGVAMVEGANVSVGRGTDSPFEVLGAPWIDARQLASYLNARRLSGIRFVPIDFTPTANRHANQLCHGVNFIVTDRNQLNSPELGVELASALFTLYPQQFQMDKMGELLLSHSTLEMLHSGADPRRIADEWRERREAWQSVRAKYLLY